MLHKKDSSIATLALLLTLVVVPKPAAASEKNPVILAQTPNNTNPISLPKTVKSGTKVRIDGSSSTATFNQALKQRFEKEYPGTQVNIGYRGTNAALNSLRKGQIDIAAIGRPLTDKEKAQGLVAVPLPRTKIAVVVGPKNTFKGSITDVQFARIFRGEIRDWSRIGGKRGRIRMIDRPINSDTRQALRKYPVFRNRPFRSGSNTVRLSQDNTTALLNILGTNGIGYTISNQVVNRPNARIVLMHKVSTNDPKYPFSQPVFYVYRRNNPSAAALAFIGFANAPGGQQVVKAAAGIPVAATPTKAIVAAKPKPAATPPTAVTGTPGSGNAVTGENQATTTTPAEGTAETDTRGGFSWLWWLIPLLLLLGIPLAWLLKNRRPATTAVGGQTPPPPVTGGTTSEAPTGTIVPPVTNPTETIAPVPVPETTPPISPPTQIQETTAPPLWGEDSLPTAEIPSETATPGTIPNWLGIGGAAAVGGAALAGAAATAKNWDSTITLEAENHQSEFPSEVEASANATWQVSEAHKQALREQGGEQLAIRLYDITDINQIQTEGWQIFQQFNVNEQANQMLLPILVSDRDYIAEIGYLTTDNLWLTLAKSNPINIPPFVPPVTEVVPSPKAALTLTTPADWGSIITLTPQSSQLALATWQVSDRHKQALREQGGTQLVLRLYDVTETPIDEQTTGDFPQFAVDETANQMLVAIPQTNRDYASEIGYLTNDNRWLLLARSAPINIAPSIPTTAEIAANIPTLTLPETPTTSTITLTEFDKQQALAAWVVLDEHKQILQQQGGKELALRLYDVTEITRTATESWDIFQQFDVDEQASQMLLPILMSDRDYAAEIGYLTEDNRWLLLARSAPIKISSDIPPATEVELAPGVAAAVASTPTTSYISLAPETANQLIANWQTSPEHKQALQQQGGRHLVLRLYDVTEIDINSPEPQISQQFAIDEQANEMLLEVPVFDRNYAAEIGYLTDDNRWLLLARSAPIHIVSPPPATTETPTTSWDSTITLAPENSRQAIANWQVSYNHKQALREQGGRQLAIRLYDVTEIDLAQDNPQIFQQFPVNEQTSQIVLHIPLINRDYVAEIGYLTNDDNWLMAARSTPLKIVPDVSPEREIELGTLAALGAMGAIGAVVTKDNEVPPIVDDSDSLQSEIEAAKFNLGSEELDQEVLAAVDEGLPDLPSGYDESRIVLMPRDPQWAYTYWDIPSRNKEELRQQGGSKLALRFYDVTDVDMDYQNPHSVQEFECDEMGREWYLPVPVSDRDYILEIGYLTNDGRWLMLARSNSIHVPPLYPSNWSNEQFITIPWEEELEHKQFLDLGSPSPEITVPGNGFHDSFFHEMPAPNLAAQSVSSYIFPSGIGKWASGIGFASEAPERSRNFWLMADAELVVYGATEPDAVITIGGRPIKANSDGTFRFQLSFQDGMLDFPIEAIAPDGEQSRSIHLKFNRETPLRNTNTKEEAQEE
ncbi:hypothetical protein NIES2119_18760 [[Phormidium ambiguum] IAM M-71]|uniref:PBP domain-containing protein n=1 Tax=[Phormidium ambiguum] IAM M-71 TaxID=454136 RepID=A0A1U7IGB9_9CYAN|nr:DUF4912 domain-containing protein [Phormidium ambiguum]OKH36033.1 hypothetical protein NIES2119_18760 [Phormidium ambiguum IAM M-71]